MDVRVSKNGLSVSKDAHIKSEKLLNYLAKSSKRSKVMTKHGGYSKAGISKYDPIKPNQDRFISSINMLLTPQRGFNQIKTEKQSYPLSKKIDLFGVFDGHGKDGHHVSEYIKEKLPYLIRKALAASKKPIPTILKDCMEKIDKNLLKSDIESNLSGSTSIFTIVKDIIQDGKVIKKLYVANTGDSRALF